MKQELIAFFREEDGVTAIEYGLIAGLIAVVLVTTLTDVGKGLKTLFTTITDRIGEANTGAGGTAG
jgi:pilus assembly protein Flp/PilA